MKIQHLKCSICGRNITEKVNEEEVFGMVFRVSRTKESYDVAEDGELEMGEGNEKMNMEFCEECFLNILNESKSLGKLFLNKEKKCFVY